MITSIGMPTLIEFQSILENYEFARKNGFNLLEVNMDLPYARIEVLQQLTPQEDFSYSVHLPEAIDVWNVNYRIRNAYIESVEEIIAIAHKKRIQIINMHMNPGVSFTLPDRKVFLWEQGINQFLDYTSEFAERIHQLISGTGLYLCIENTGIYGLNFITEGVMAMLNFDSVCLTWDIGHDYSAKCIDRSFITKHKDRLRYLHLHDAIGSKNHLALGDGEIDIQEVFETISNQQVSVVLETKTSNELLKSARYFHSLLS